MAKQADKRGTQMAKAVPVSEIRGLEIDERAHPLGLEGLFTPTLMREAGQAGEVARIRLAVYVDHDCARGLVEALERALRL